MKFIENYNTTKHLLIAIGRIVWFGLFSENVSMFPYQKTPEIRMLCKPLTGFA